MLAFRDLVQISRPRFWLYTAGPVLVAYAAAGLFDTGWWSYGWNGDTIALLVFMLFFFFFFMFPANLLIYGVNDLADGDTDILNTKKGTYEQRVDMMQYRSLKRSILKRNIVPWVVFFSVPLLLFVVTTRRLDIELLREYRMLFLLFILGGKIIPWIILGVFLFTACFYSLPPIRAKARPFLDGLFNILYILPGIFVYLLYAPVESLIWSSVVAGWLRCMAMHAYSAIPDIVPDREAGLLTTAVYLGEKKTLLYCAVLRIGAGFLVSGIFPLFAIIATSVYVFLVSLSFRYPVFALYKLFPWINACIGFWLFRLVVLS